MRHVEIYFRDYKNANGLMVPYVLERPHRGNLIKMTIESMVVNRKLDDSLFMAPNANPSAK